MESKVAAVDVHDQRSSRDADEKSASPMVQRASSDSLDAHKPTTIGKMTPALMIAFYLIAVATAVGHFLYCLFLNSRTVAETIPQTWNNAISVTFAHLFSATLAASASTAFTQLLWWFLRRRSLSLAKVDALFALNSSATNLYRLSILKAVPVLWFFGLVIPLISVATIFPPGSLVIRQIVFETDLESTMPTLNINNRGNGSAADFFEYAMFSLGTDGEYRTPDVRYSSIAKRTLLEGKYITGESPCGANCTYSASFAAPSLRCDEDSPNSNLEAKLSSLTNNTSNVDDLSSSWNSSLVAFMAATYISTAGDQFIFDITYNDVDTGELKNISCVTLDSTYHARVNYKNLQQTVTVNITEGKPLNASILTQKSLFVDVLNSVPTADGFAYNPEYNYNNFTFEQLFEIYHATQVRTMRDTFVRAITGAISSFGTENYFTANTIIQETKLAKPSYDSAYYTFTDLYFNLSAPIIEDLMKNISISIFNDAQDEFSTMVNYIEYEPGYIFVNRPRLIAAYGGALLVCLVFILLGFGALIQNGVSASSGSFMQILCTTTHTDSAITQIARKACHGGAEGIPEDLSKLEVRFGEVTNEVDGRKYAAFGTVEETEVLKKVGK